MDWCLLCTFMRLDQWPREWIPVSKVSLHSVFSHKSSCLPSMHQGLSQRLLVVQAKTSNTPKSRAKMNLLSFGYGTSSKGLVQAWSLAGRSNHKELPVSWGGGFPSSIHYLMEFTKTCDNCWDKGTSWLKVKRECLPHVLFCPPW